MIAQLNLKQFVREKEAEWRRDISWGEISQATGIHINTLTRISSSRSQRIDLGILYKLCEFFGVPDGSPIPFLIFKREELPHAANQ